MTNPAYQPSVLIVEDSPLHARIMMTMLGEFGIPDYKVGSVGALGDAIQMISHWKPDCVLLDLTLPDAKGIEAVEAMVAAIPDVPVIVVSGSDDPDIAEQVVAAGAQEFIPKFPPGGDSLQSLVRFALARRIATEHFTKSVALKALTDLAAITR